MPVNFDAKFSEGLSSVSSISYVSNTGDVPGSVGANSNRVLIAVLQMWGVGVTTGITNPAITWNGVGMTLIGTLSDATNNFLTHIFGLKNPATGAQTLAATWTGGSVPSVCLSAWSVYDADQTTGWQNLATNGGTGTSVSQGVTSANGNMALVALTDANATSASITAGTSDWNERDLDHNFNGGHLASSSGTTTLTWTLGSSVAWGTVGVDVIAASAGITMTPSQAAATLTGTSLVIGKAILMPDEP